MAGTGGSTAAQTPAADRSKAIDRSAAAQSSIAGAGMGAAAALSVEHRLLHAGFDPQSPCTCATAALEHRWCWRCNVGYVAGERIESAALFEGLDPHGHELDNESLQLQSCRDAIESDGYCETVGLGFVAGKAYFTRLTWGLARGVAMDRTALACETCRALPEGAAQPRWCETCGRGLVGNTALTDRDMFDRTAREYGLLLAAIEKSSTCSFCAVAIVAHLTCPTCQISYESGELSAASLRPGAALKERSEPEGS